MKQSLGEKVKVKYVGESCFEFDKGQILDATFLKSDPNNLWYVIKSLRDGEEYAFPRTLFEVVEQ